MYGSSDTLMVDICSVFCRFPNADEVFGTEDLGTLYKVDIYKKNIDTPIGDHIDRVGLPFYTKDEV